MEDALKIQIQESYVTNMLTNTKNILRAILNLSVHLETVQEGKCWAHRNLKNENFLLAILYWEKGQAQLGHLSGSAGKLQTRPCSMKLWNFFSKMMQAILFQGYFLLEVSTLRNLSIKIYKNLECSRSQFEHSLICLKHSRLFFSFPLAEPSVRIVSSLPPREMICLQSHKRQA